MTNKYRITIKPTGAFYFGGERSEDRRDYFTRSRLFPQQTSLLGMIRFVLLQSNDCLDYSGERPVINDTNKAQALIGKKSFDGNKDQNFGAIKKMSPLFLRYDNEDYFYSLTDTDLTLAFTDDTAYFKTSEGKAYDAKQPPTPVFKSLLDLKKQKMVFSSEEHKEDYVFKEDTKIGIKREYDSSNGRATGRTSDSDEGFYKQTSYRMHKDCSFSFYLELDSNSKFPEEAFVSLGGENGLWVLNSEPANFPEFDANKSNRLVLLSDTLCNNDIYDHCHLAYSEVINFWNFQINTGDNRHHFKPVKAKGNHDIKLLHRGSWLYPNDINELKKCLSNPAWEAIGYNQFITF